MKKEYHIVERALTNQLDYERAEFPKVDFSSITKRLSLLSKEHRVVCPKCGGAVNFNDILEWYGPSHFTCNQCQKLVHIRRIKVRANQ